MKIEDIKNNKFEVTIINIGKDGDGLCFRVYNKYLKMFIISKCHLNIDPRKYSFAYYHLNGNAEIKIDDEINSYYIVFLNIYYDNPQKGYLTFLRY